MGILGKSDRVCGVGVGPAQTLSKPDVLLINTAPTQRDVSAGGGARAEERGFHSEDGDMRLQVQKSRGGFQQLLEAEKKPAREEGGRGM